MAHARLGVSLGLRGPCHDKLSKEELKLRQQEKIALQTSKTVLEPPWKKLLARLEHGEKITVQVTLSDSVFGETKLSQIPEERANQVARVQDEFLKKLPSNLILKDIKKDAYYPYIFIEATPDLLTYLFSEQALLKIKTIAELTVR